MPFTRYTPVWTGFTGSPGYTVLNFFDELTTGEMTLAAGRVEDFFTAIAARIPDIATITYPGEATIHDNTGVLTGALAITPPTSTNCVGLGSYAAPVGARVGWETGTISGGRRVRGRTFLVPLVSSTFDTDGTLTSANLTVILNAATAFLAGLATDGVQLAVWSQVGSSVSPVNSATVPDQATVLRSRRD
jgi:hypothetical protein